MYNLDGLWQIMEEMDGEESWKGMLVMAVLSVATEIRALRRVIEYKPIPTESVLGYTAVAGDE